MVRPIVRETIIDRRQAHVRWGAVFAGTATAVGAWIALQLLGLGVGLSAIDTDQGGNLRAIGIGTGIWSVIAPLIALFVGALVGARLAGTFNRSIGALHGIVMWGVTTAVGVFAVISVVGAVAAGVARVGATAASAAGSAVSAVAPAATSAPELAQALGIDTQDLLAPVNNYLREQGKPAVTGDQLTAILGGVAQHGLHQGHIDRQVLVDETAKNTSLSRADAQDLANRFGDRYDQALGNAQQQMQSMGQQAKQTALDAADTTGHVALSAGIALLIALGAAAAGGALGVPRAPREPQVAVETPIPAA